MSFDLAQTDVSREARAHAFDLQDRIEQALKDGEGDPVEMPLRHFFADGCYVREIFMPAGAVVVGHIHKHEHVAISCGDYTIVDHSGRKRMQGYQVFISQPGAKRCLVIHRDTVFTTIHRLRDPDQRDIETLEREYVARTAEEFERYLALESEQCQKIEATK